MRSSSPKDSCLRQQNPSEHDHEVNHPLPINNDKTNLMFFSNSKEYINLSGIQLNNSIIKNVSSVRFLGVEMDKNLKFNLHINDLAKKNCQKHWYSS